LPRWISSPYVLAPHHSSPCLAWISGKQTCLFCQCTCHQFSWPVSCVPHAVFLFLFCEDRWWGCIKRYLLQAGRRSLIIYKSTKILRFFLAGYRQFSFEQVTVICCTKMKHGYCTITIEGTIGAHSLAYLCCCVPFLNPCLVPDLPSAVWSLVLLSTIGSQIILN
jgi:hypothetical protein